MTYSNYLFLIFTIVTVSLFIGYCAYILYKKKDELSDFQERRISTLILIMLFFVLSLMYREFWGSNCFIVIWFLYALYHSFRELHRTISVKCNKRSTDSRCIE